MIPRLWADRSSSNEFAVPSFGQTCTVSNGSGTVSTDITNVDVTYTTNTYTIGGTVNGQVAQRLRVFLQIGRLLIRKTVSHALL